MQHVISYSIDNIAKTLSLSWIIVLENIFIHFEVEKHLSASVIVIGVQ